MYTSGCSVKLSYKYVNTFLFLLQSATKWDDPPSIEMDDIPSIAKEAEPVSANTSGTESLRLMRKALEWYRHKGWFRATRPVAATKHLLHRSVPRLGLRFGSLRTTSEIHGYSINRKIDASERVYPMESNVFDVVSLTSSSSHCPLSPVPP